MKPTPSLSVVLLAAVVGGCTTHRAPPQLPLPPLPAVGGLRGAAARSAPLTLKVTAPVPLFPWMEINAFFPRGAKHLYPRDAFKTPALADSPRAWFPSEVECTSPDGEWTLYHNGYQQGSDLDYVIFARRRGAERARAIFQTKCAVEVLWAPDSTKAAVTVMTGGNRSVVLLVRMEDMKPTDAIWPIEELKKYFSLLQIEAPQFMMALRWTGADQLVIRARGQELVEPRTIFGYEVLVDPDHLDQPAWHHFLRGYLKTPDPAAPAPGGDASAVGERATPGKTPPAR